MAGTGPAGGAGSHLGDMIAAWTAKGAPEFVPGPPAGPTGPLASSGGPGGAGVPGRWPMPSPPLPGPWQGMPGGMGQDMPWPSPMGPGMGAVSGAQQNAQRLPPARTLVVAWNLSPTYSNQDLLHHALENIDFTPAEMRPCKDVAGSYVFWYNEGWQANALIVSLDGTSEHLKSNGNPVHLSKWNIEEEKFTMGAEEVPEELHEALKKAGLLATN